MTTTVSLQTIFDECTAKIKDPVGAAIRFVYLVGKTKVGTLQECRALLGYTSEDKNKNITRSAAFSKKILTPLRVHLTMETNKLSKQDAEKVWAHGATDEKSKSIRKEINGLLPANTRAGKESLNIGELLSEV